MLCFFSLVMMWGWYCGFGVGHVEEGVCTVMLQWLEVVLRACVVFSRKTGALRPCYCSLAHCGSYQAVGAVIGGEGT